MTRGTRPGDTPLRRIWAAGFLALAWMMAILVECAAGDATGARWGPAMQLSAGPGDVWWRGIAASGDLVHLVWGSDPIRYRRSVDQGRTWSDDVVVSASGQPVLTDPLAAQGSSVYLVYLRNLTTTRDWCCRRPLGDIFFRRSLDGGLTWQPEIRLTTAGGALRIALAASGARVHLVWMDFRTGRWDIYHRGSPDGGGTWGPEVRLAAGAAGFGAERPQVAARGASVHVVWFDGRDGNPGCYTTPECPEVYYKRSTDGGRSWDGDVRLTSDTPFSGRPDVAALAGATVIVSYDEDRDDNSGHEQYVLRSTDDGATWAPPVRLSFAPGESQHGALAAAGSAVHLSWFDRRGEDTEIYYRASFDGGASWQPEERVTAGGSGATTPLLAVTPDYVHVTWLDRRTGSNQVWYRRRNTSPDSAAPLPDRQGPGDDGKRLMPPQAEGRAP